MGYSQWSKWQVCACRIVFRRVLPISLVLIVFLTACKKHNEIKPAPSEFELQQRLVGKWSCSKDYTNELSTNGTTFESSVTVASNGTYVGDLSEYNPTHLKSWHIEGTWKINNGFLIDTITKHSSTNAILPIEERAKIIRFDTNELILQWELSKSNFEESIFHRRKSN